MKVILDAGEMYPTLFLRDFDEVEDYASEAVEMPDQLVAIYTSAIGSLEIAELQIARWCRDNMDLEEGSYSLRRWVEETLVLEGETP